MDFTIFSVQSLEILRAADLTAFREERSLPYERVATKRRRFGLSGVFGFRFGLEE